MKTAVLFLFLSVFSLVACIHSNHDALISTQKQTMATCLAGFTVTNHSRVLLHLTQDVMREMPRFSRLISSEKKMKKRKFYIIAHNPNTVDQAMAALQEGANALGPDIMYDENEFWVYHRTFFTPYPGENALTLKEYCSQLAARLSENPTHGLALIVWDMKNVENQGFEFHKVKDIIKANFKHAGTPSAHLRALPMLFTHADNYSYLLQQVAPSLQRKWALGIDELDAPEAIYRAFKGNGFSYSYANGISFFAGNTMNYITDIQDAIALRDTKNSFSMVYGWTVNSVDRMAAYLDTGVDGIITNRPAQLKALIDSDYADRFEMATRTDNPFGRGRGHTPRDFRTLELKGSEKTRP